MTSNNASDLLAALIITVGCTILLIIVVILMFCFIRLLHCISKCCTSKPNYTPRPVVVDEAKLAIEKQKRLDEEENRRNKEIELKHLKANFKEIENKSEKILCDIPRLHEKLMNDLPSHDENGRDMRLNPTYEYRRMTGERLHDKKKTFEELTKKLCHIPLDNYEKFVKPNLNRINIIERNFEAIDREIDALIALDDTNNRMNNTTQYGILNNIGKILHLIQEDLYAIEKDIKEYKYDYSSYMPSSSLYVSGNWNRSTNKI